MLTPTKEALFEQTTAASMVVTVAKNDDVTAESSWTCSCGKQWPSTHKRCGNTKCQKWKGGKREDYVHRPKVSKASNNNTTTNHEEQPQDLHVVPAIPQQQQQPAASSWTCDNCQNIVKGTKSRCGNCHRWKGGKRKGGWKLNTTVNTSTQSVNNNNNGNTIGDLSVAPFGGAVMGGTHGGGAVIDGGIAVNNTTSNNDTTSNIQDDGTVKKNATATKHNNKNSHPSSSSSLYDTTQDWTCNHCSTILPGKQTRCGKCHRWRGGKRKGGWTLKANSRSRRHGDNVEGGEGEGEDDDGIDRTQDWTCCDVILPAKQTRCGKCNGWRGGKRVFSGKGTNNHSSSSSNSIGNKKVRAAAANNHNNNNNRFENDQLVLEGGGMGASLPPPLRTNTNAEANSIVFEYPSLPSISTTTTAAAAAAAQQLYSMHGHNMMLPSSVSAAAAAQQLSPLAGLNNNNNNNNMMPSISAAAAAQLFQMNGHNMMPPVSAAAQSYSMHGHNNNMMPPFVSAPGQQLFLPSPMINNNNNNNNTGGGGEGGDVTSSMEV